jgi:hypothetical protein
LKQPAAPSQHLHIHGVTTDERIAAARAFLLSSDPPGATPAGEPDGRGAGGILGKTEAEQAKILDLVTAPPDYTHDPVGYCRNVLQVTLTHDQEQIARACLEHPYKVLVNSAQSVGKTFLAAALVNWFFDTFDPSVVITTATGTGRAQVNLLARLTHALPFYAVPGPPSRASCSQFAGACFHSIFSAIWHSAACST